ncbi:hypothetical protein BCR41DRAFT_42643 [Lobosporangium transversale]|uniref:Uncharacterized protein n=1 Tax=Lobosporangium transversale TaxID=64571 RepID=A0A1Y2GQV9_9FUNG|nr:hypothetical protein BCR41DRAFT_42643 [Lobosporangium transversale]ORZ19269.1 hypothetical protein BCR41DRAFT_42643 [Lobosporangium transversale]|eukprot:XP_021882437.1 hypothetical protein BCR41DRAFT_42643 [Lobosporangium transversale]
MVHAVYRVWPRLPFAFIPLLPCIEQTGVKSFVVVFQFRNVFIPLLLTALDYQPYFLGCYFTHLRKCHLLCLG